MNKNSVKDKYPYKITKSGEEIMTLREDEVESIKGHLVLEVGDAFERLLWERSNAELHDIKTDILSVPGKPNHGQLFLCKTIDKILDQRKFMIDNQAFRNALMPE